MTPCAQKFISDKELATLERIKAYCDHLPDIDLGKDEKGEQIILSCHILARALAHISKLKCVDGYFYPRHQHSWLVTNQGNIIDVYPVAIIGGPFIVEANHGIVARALYTPIPTRRISEGRFGKTSFRRSVQKIYDALKAN